MTLPKNTRSPWPACADCHVNAPDEPQGDERPVAIDATDDDIPLSQDLGPWASEVRRRAAEALARAIARAQNETTTKVDGRKSSADPRRT